MKRCRRQKPAPLRSWERLEDRLLLTATPEVEPNDSIGDLVATSALSIVPNTPSQISGEISQLGDVDLYKVDLLAGETLTADIDTPSPHSLNSFLRVFDSTGTEYTAGIGSPTNDDDGMSTDSKVQIQILTSGTYYIGVSDNSYFFYDANNANSTLGSIFGSSTGSYQLSVLVSTPTAETEPNDVKSQANVPVVQPGTPAILSGTIDPAGDVDLYKVHLNFGDTLTADIDAAVIGSSLDSYLRVFDSAGVEVANNDNDGSSTDSLITFQAQAAGDYYVGVSDFVNSQYSIDNTDNRFGVFTGDYQLKLNIDAVPDAGDTLNTATALSLDPLSSKTLPGSIDSAGDADLYQVNLSAGDTLDVKVAASQFGALDSYVRMFDANGNQVAANNDDGSGTDSHLNFVVPAAGTYYVGISSADNTAYNPNTTDSGSGSGTGDYLATFLLSPQDGDDTLATAHTVNFLRGQAYDFSGSLANGLDVDFYALSLVAGDTLHLSNTGDATGRLRVFDANGNQVAAADHALDFLVSATGKYFVGLSGVGNTNYNPQQANSGAQSSDIGTNDLSIQVDSAAPVTVEAEPNNSIGTPNVIAPSGTVVGATAISTAGDVDYYMFTVTTAGQYTAQAIANSGSALDAQLTLFGADGNVLTTSDDAAPGNANPLISIHLEPGVYFLKVQASLGASAVASVGGYHLTTAFTAAGSPFGPQTSAGDYPIAIASGDFNHDGKIDLVSADNFAPNQGISIYLGLGDLSYQPAQLISAGDNPSAVVVGDFNGDGNLDLAVANQFVFGLSGGPFGSNIEILLGNGDGTFAAPVSVAVGNGPMALVTGDFNGDHKLDLAVANSASNSITILLGDGSGGFHHRLVDGSGNPLLNGSGNPQDDVPVGTQPIALAAADLNGDGKLDLAVANSGSNSVTVLLGDGSGAFHHRLVDNSGNPVLNGSGNPQDDIAVGNRPTSIAIADFNGDGKLDLAVANADSDDVSLSFNQGGGAFSAETRIDLRNAPPVTSAGDIRSFVAAGNFNSDGVADLVYGFTGDPRISVALGNRDASTGKANGTFAASQQFSSDIESKPYAVVVADLNGDGRLDFATADQGANHISVFGGLNDGTFLSGARLDVGNEPRGLIALDTNHDGRTDLISANADDASVLLGNGDGTFANQLRAQAGTPNAIASGDFNGDGRPDLVAVDFAAGVNEIEILLGLGDGTYTALAPITNIGSFLSAVVVGDFNGDGKLDFAVTSRLDNTAIVFLGNGDGTFAAQTPIAVGSEPVAIVAGDFNGDHKTDLAVADQSGNRINILLGDGNGSFHHRLVDGSGNPILDGSGNPTDDVITGNQPISLVAADFNHDGILDLAVANSGDSTVSLFLGGGSSGVGNATFAASGTFAVGSGPRSLVVNDFNGDGLPDLATANTSANPTNAPADNTVSVLINQGSGTFAAEKRFTVSSALNLGVSPMSIVSGDFNGDGIEDLATANAASRNVSVLLGKGDGTFGAPDVPSSTVLNNAPITADFNGDSVADLVSIDAAGHVLLRLGRKDQPGTFAPAIVVNPAAAASSYATFEDGSKNLLGVLDRAGTFATLYRFNKAGLPKVVSHVDLQSHFDRIVSASLNGDNRDDLIALDANGGPLARFLGSGNTFDIAGGVQVQVDASPSALLTGNFDSTGSIDALLADQATGNIDLLQNPFSGSATTTAYRGSTQPFGVAQPDGAATSVSPLVFDGAGTMAVGDFNEDHVPDVVVAHRGTNSFSLLVGKAGGGFTNPSETLAGSQPIAIQTADFNGDKHLDIAVLNAGTHDVSIFLGDGHGHFTLVHSYDVGDAPTGLSLVDANGDKKIDLLVSNTAGDVTVLPGNGNGTFVPFTRIDRSMAISVGDLNGDGKPDWVVTNHTSDRLVVENGSQSSGLVQNSSNGLSAPAGVAVADINHDGLDDMIVANSGGNDVLMYLGLGGGQFAPAKSFFAGTDPVDVQVANVNGDHYGNGDPILDVVVTNYGSNDISVLLGTGNSATLLKTGVRLNAGQGPTSTQAVDTNGDGTADFLLVTNSVSSNVMMLPSVGAGFFNDVTPTVFNTGRNPTGTIVGNFGGQLGFVTLNRDSNSLTMYTGFNSAFRTDLASGGNGPISAVAADFNNDGLMDLVVGNNGNGVFSVFDGSQSGLALANSFSDPSLSHPAALAVADFGNGKELQLLALDEGDELVHVFDRDQVTNDVTNVASDQLFALANQSVGTSIGANSNSVVFALVAALGITAEGLLQSTEAAISQGGGTDVVKNFSQSIFDELGTALEHGKHIFQSTIHEFGTMLGGDMENSELAKTLGDTVSEFVSLLLPRLPIKALPALIQGILTKANAAGTPTPYAADQAMENYDADSWVSEIGPALEQAIGWRSEPSSAIDRNLSAPQRLPTADWRGEMLPANLGTKSANGIDEQIPPSANSTAVQPNQRNGKATYEASGNHARALAVAAVMGAIGLGGWLVRSRRRPEECDAVLL